MDAPNRFRTVGWATILLAGVLLGRCALATPPVPQTPEESPSTEPSNGESEPGGFAAGLARSDYLLGDMGGLRPLLSKYGMSLTIEETSEVLGNVSGGTRQGADYDGLTQMDLQL